MSHLSDLKVHGFQPTMLCCLPQRTRLRMPYEPMTNKKTHQRVGHHWRILGSTGDTDITNTLGSHNPLPSIFFSKLKYNHTISVSLSSHQTLPCPSLLPFRFLVTVSLIVISIYVHLYLCTNLLGPVNVTCLHMMSVLTEHLDDQSGSSCLGKTASPAVRSSCLYLLGTLSLIPKKHFRI